MSYYQATDVVCDQSAKYLIAGALTPFREVWRACISVKPEQQDPLGESTSHSQDLLTSASGRGSFACRIATAYQRHEGEKGRRLESQKAPQQQRISRSASTRRRDETFSIPTSVPSRMPALPTLLYAQGCKVATTQSKGEYLSTKANRCLLRSTHQQATNKSPSYQRHVSSTNPAPASHVLSLPPTLLTQHLSVIPPTIAF
jgi:hypothetical protein